MSHCMGGPFPDLPISPRQAEVLDCLVKGMTLGQIARNLQISLSAVKNHLKTAAYRMNLYDPRKNLSVTVAVEWYYRNNPEARV